MTTTPISLRDLRRKLYAKAKAELAGSGGVRSGYIPRWGCSMVIERASICGQPSRLYRSHNPWPEANR